MIELLQQRMVNKPWGRRADLGYFLTRQVTSDEAA
jgi:hypothetical protein